MARLRLAGRPRQLHRVACKAAKSLQQGRASMPDCAVPTPIAVDANDAAALFGLSSRTWRRLNAAGLIPSPLRLGGSVRWRRDELVAWAAAGSPTRSRW